MLSVENAGVCFTLTAPQMTSQPAGRGAVGSTAQMFGRYRLLGRLAAGGMAEVWAAQLLAAGGFAKSMVIKRVLPELAENPQFLRMLMSEARVAARLSHSNICSVFELGDVDGEYYIAMEYLRGAPLTELLRAGSLPAPAAAAIIAQACDGMHYAHEQRDSSGQLLGLVHRDVSPHKPVPHRRRRGQGARLRHREGRRREQRAHRGRQGEGQAALYVARAARRAADRSAQRRVVARRRLVGNRSRAGGCSAARRRRSRSTRSATRRCRRSRRSACARPASTT